MQNIVLLVGDAPKPGFNPTEAVLEYTAEHLLNYQSIYYYKHRWPGFSSWVSKQYWAGPQPAEPHKYPLNMNTDFSAPIVDTSGYPYLRYRCFISDTPMWPYCEIETHPAFTISKPGGVCNISISILPILWGTDTKENRVTLLELLNTDTGFVDVALVGVRDPVTKEDAYCLEIFDGKTTRVSGILTVPNAGGIVQKRRLDLHVSAKLLALELASDEVGNKYTEIHTSEFSAGGSGPKLRLLRSLTSTSEDLEVGIYNLYISSRN